VSSIRVFLVVVLLATITLTVFLSALHGYRISMEQAQQLFDLKLADAAHLLDDAGNRYLGGVAPSARQFGFQVWEDGILRQRSANVPPTPISRFESGYHFNNFSNYRWRTFAWQAPGRQRWIMTAERVDLRIELGEGIILKSVLPVVASLPVAGLLIWWIVGYGLSPLRQLASRLHNKRATELGALPVEHQPEELIRLITSINDLLRRLEASFERERQFAADAAHELRTPISVLKVHMHNLAQDLPHDHHDLLQLEQAADRMGKVTEQILLLNRTSPDHYQAQFSRIDLHALAQQCIADHYDVFDTRHQSIELKGCSLMMRGDSFALQMLIGNLLENAGKYTPVQGSIRVIVEMQQGNPQLVVEDSGPGIPDGQYDRVFDRFYRVGGDHHDSGVVGCGLGLSIVRQIAKLHHAAVTMSHSGFATGLRVTVGFPSRAHT
jgi:two-component system, OmpR family, sensor histidine kinase QseC